MSGGVQGDRRGGLYQLGEAYDTPSGGGDGRHKTGETGGGLRRYIHVRRRNNARTAAAEATILYDGTCAKCRTWAAKHETGTHITAWQDADLVRYGLTRESCERSVQYIDEAGVHGGAEAVARIWMRAGGWYWILGWLATRPGVRVIAAMLYRVRARARRRDVQRGL